MLLVAQHRMKADYLRTRLMSQVDADETRAKLFVDYEAATIPYLAAEREGRSNKLSASAKTVLEAFTALGPFTVEKMEAVERESQQAVVSTRAKRPPPGRVPRPRVSTRR